MAAACNPAAFAIPDGQLPEVGALTAYPASDRYGAPVIELGGDSLLSSASTSWSLNADICATQ